MPKTLEAGMRLAIYARVSTEEQREGQTIDSQVAELERFAKEQCWQITGIYKDEGWSGGVMARPELDRLRDDARNGLFQAVLINDVDRLARDVSHLGVIKRDLEKQDVRVIFRKLPSDSSPAYNLMVNILGSFAEFERELISDRTRRGRRHKVEVRKQYLGSNTAYGYQYVPKDRVGGQEGMLQLVPEEAAVVRQMFEWVDQEGLSARRVLNRLNELKIRPRNGALRWSKSSVLRMLHNEMYAGIWHYNKFEGCEPKRQSGGPRYRKRSKSSVRQRPRTEWLPLVLPESLRLVPRERWERVQHQLDQNIAFSPRNEKHVYLLKGLVQCGGCKSRYVGDPCHGRFYYRCLARCKRFPTIRDAALDEAVKEAIEDLMLHPSMISEPVRCLDKAEALEANQQKDQAKIVEDELQRIQAEEDRLLEAYRKNIISPAQLGAQLEKLNASRAAVELTRTKLLSQRDAPPPEQIEKEVSDFCAEAARNLKNCTQEKWREFLRIIIRAIIFEGTQIRIQGEIPLASHSVVREEAAEYCYSPYFLNGRIATMTIGPCGRNLAREYRDSHSKKMSGVQVIPCAFEVEKPIVRPPRPDQPRDELGRFCRGPT